MARRSDLNRSPFTSSVEKLDSRPIEDKWKLFPIPLRACELNAELQQNPASSGLSPLPWSPYAGVHQQIRALDESGKWDEAVTLARGEGNATFTAFDTSSDSTG